MKRLFRHEELHAIFLLALLGVCLSFFRHVTDDALTEWAFAAHAFAAGACLWGLNLHSDALDDLVRDAVFRVLHEFPRTTSARFNDLLSHASMPRRATWERLERVLRRMQKDGHVTFVRGRAFGYAPEWHVMLTTAGRTQAERQAADAAYAPRPN